MSTRPATSSSPPADTLLARDVRDARDAASEDRESPGGLPPMVARPPAAPMPAADVSKFRPRACARCSASKLKCNWVSEPGEAPCERCARSKTECVLPNLKPRGPRRGNPTRVGQLEQKIDGIMSLLTASQQIQRTSPSAQPLAPSTPSDGPDIRETYPAGPSVSVPHSPDPLVPQYHQPTTPAAPATALATPLVSHRSSFTTASSSASSIAQQSQQSQQPQQPQQPQQQVLPPFQAICAPPLEHVEIIPGLKITFHDAELALADYRQLCSPVFPFVPLPLDTPAHELYQKQPLLFCVVVLAVLPQPPHVQWEARRWIREQLALHVVVREEKTVSLLQAALCSLAWSEFGYYIESRITSVLQLATGLVIDLGLQKSPALWFAIPGKNIFEAARAMTTMPLPHQKEHSLADMRAALGCYYMCALCAVLCRRTYTLPYSSYFDHCCASLLKAQEFESDSFLIALVRLQQLAYRIHVVLPNPDSDPAPAWTSYAPMFMSITTIRRELDALVQNQPPEVKSHFALWTHYHVIVMRLYEPAMYMRSSVAGTIDPADAVQRTECLWSCLQAVRDFFKALLAVPLGSLSLLPFPSTLQLSFSIVTVMRLLFLVDDPDWDVVRARKSFDFVALSLRLEDQLRAAEDLEDRQGALPSSSIGGLAGIGRKKRVVYDENRSILSTFRDRLRQIRQWYIAKLPPDQRSMSAAAAAAQTAGDAASPAPAGRSSRLSDPLAVQQPRSSSGSYMDLDNIGMGITDENDVAFWKSIFSMDTPWDAMPFS